LPLTPRVLCLLSYGDKGAMPQIVRASRNAPEPGTNLVRCGVYGRRLSLSYARMNGGMPWTRTTLPFRGAHCLANRSGSLVRLTFQIGPRGRTRTCNLSVLSGMPLHWATRGCLHKSTLCPRSDFHRHSTSFKCVASALGYVGEIGWYRVKDFHPQPPRSERDASSSWANAA